MPTSSNVAGTLKTSPPSVATSTPGIMKADWFTKHRSKRPSVALVFVDRKELEGDPNTWNRMLYNLKTIRDAVSPRGAGMVLALVQDPDAGEPPPDRIAAMCNNLALNPRLVCTVAAKLGGPHTEASRAQRDAALRALGLLVHEQCAAYYARRAKHVADKHAQRQAAEPDKRCAPEVNARAAIKLAVFAEFRQDWRTAVSEYQAAYSHVRAIVAASAPPAQGPPPSPAPSLQSVASSPALYLAHGYGGQGPVGPEGPLGAGALGSLPASLAPSPMHTPSKSMGVIAPGTPTHMRNNSMGIRMLALSPQRFAAAARVAELLQLKLLMLLTYQQRLEEAVAQANSHLQFFARPPVILAPAAGAAHLGYMVRQYQVAAELLPPKLEGTPLAAAAKECSRATLLMSAAQAAVDRTRALAALRDARAASAQPMPTLDTGAIKKGPYMGMVVLRTDSGSRELTDTEYLLWLEAEESRSPSGAATSSGASVSAAVGIGGSSNMGVLEVINAALLALRDSRNERLRSRLGAMMAAEHVMSSNLSAARKLLLQVAHTYRRDGWDVLLAQALLLLRDVAQRLRMPQEHITYTLELATILSTLPPSTASALGHLFVGPGQPDAALLAKSAVSSLLSGLSDVGRSSIIKAPSPQVTGSSIEDSLGGGPQQHPRTFNFTVEWLDLREAQKRAREGDLQAGADARALDAMHAAPLPRAATVADILQRHHQQDYGWWRLLAVAVGFVAGSRPDPTHLDLYVAVRSSLCVSLPVTGITVTFADDQPGEWDVPAQAAPLPDDMPASLPPDAVYPSASTSQPASNGPSASLSRGSSYRAAADLAARGRDRDDSGQDQARGSTQQGFEAAAGTRDVRNPGEGAKEEEGMGMSADGAKQRAGGQASSSGRGATPHEFVLEPGKWARVGVRVAPRAVGRLRCERVTVALGQHASVSFLVQSFPAGMSPVLGSLSERVSLGAAADMIRGSQPFKGLTPVAPGGAALPVLHVGPLPSLKLAPVPGMGPALVGEPFFVGGFVRCGPRGLPTSSVLEFAVKPMGAAASRMAPADVTILVDDRGSIERYNGQDTARVQLAPIPEGGSQAVRVWILCRQPGRLALGAVLQCPAVVSQVVEFDVEEPFEHRVRLMSEAGNHVLAPPRAAPSDAGCACLTVGQQAHVHCAVLHCGGAHSSSSGAADGAGSGALGAAGAGLNFPGANGIAGPLLEVVDVQLVPDASTGLVLMSDVRQQLAAAAGGSDSSLVMGRGDVVSLCATLLPPRLTTTAAPLGKLQLTWRRVALGPHPDPSHSRHPSSVTWQTVNLGPTTASTTGTKAANSGAAAAGPSTGKAAGTSAAAGALDAAEGQQPTEDMAAMIELSQRAPKPDGKVVATLELPRVVVQEGVLAARTLGPAQVTAGIAFTYTLQIQNFSSQAQELAVSLLDAPGFVLSGERAQQVHLPPREAGGSSSVSWLLVAHAAGHLSLPSVRVSAPRHHAQLTTQPSQVYVLPF